MPIQLIMFYTREEIQNPGGLYGRLTIDQRGKVQMDTRTPDLITAMEALGQTENRYLEPLVKSGAIRIAIPDRPKSPKQTYHPKLKQHFMFLGGLP